MITKNVFLIVKRFSFPGMLDDGHEDFETSDDLFDAIGVMLQQADESKTEDDIKEICDRLFSLLHQ